MLTPGIEKNQHHYKSPAARRAQSGETMKFRLILLAALMPLFVAGCATHQKAPGGDLRPHRAGNAGRRRPTESLDDAPSQAMLPPMQLDLPDSAKSVEPKFDLAVACAGGPGVHVRWSAERVTACWWRLK